MENRVLVNEKTTVKYLLNLYISSNNILKVLISDNLTAKELVILAEKHKNKKYTESLYELIALHKNCNDKICLLLLRLSKQSNCVANTIATSGKASKSILKLLSKYKNVSIKNHAKLALIKNSLDTIKIEEFDLVYDKYPGDEGIALGVRHCLSSHYRTPYHILKKLANDDSDFIAQSSRNEIERRIMFQDSEKN